MNRNLMAYNQYLYKELEKASQLQALYFEAKDFDLSTKYSIRKLMIRREIDKNLEKLFNNQNL